MIPTAPYVDPHLSAWTTLGTNPALALAAIAGRYVGDNPVRPPVWRLHHEGGPRRGWDGRYRFDFSSVADLTTGDLAVAVSSLHRDAPGAVPLSVSADGPVAVYIGGKKVFLSDQSLEGMGGSRNFEAPLSRGWNVVALVFQKTPVGFGGALGVISPYRDLRFLVPSQERRGEEGWIWTTARRGEALEPFLVAEGFSETGSGHRWFPEDGWSPDRVAQGLFGRLPGARPGTAAQWQAQLRVPTDRELTLGLTHTGTVSVWWDDTLVLASARSGYQAITVRAPRGRHRVVVESVAPLGGPWDLVWDSLDDLRFETPVPLVGVPADGALLGPYHASEAGHPHDWSWTAPSPLADGPGFWRVDRPGRLVRPGWDAPLFAQWNYPLGVTLYGLLALGRAAGRDDLVNYVRSHVEGATSFADLAAWEYATLGATNLNRQMVVLDLLDNCGSFGSLMLETATTGPVVNAEALTQKIKKFIVEDHERIDGCLYRAHHHVAHVVGTLWADDLYMSVPFLVRCARATSDASLFDDAAHQLLRFAELLAMPGTELLSHVYDVKRSVGTLVPWGRGNGWFLFSLVELLSELPEDHPRRPELLGLLATKAEGYRSVQTADGWWHQILDDPTSYAETSCTAMFTYAFARAVTRGWLPADPFANAAEAGLRAILADAIDAKGNVYGVCKGSGFAYTPSYYRDDLEWVVNDTHGVGIVLLAGVEVGRLAPSPDDSSPASDRSPSHRG